MNTNEKNVSYEVDTHLYYQNPNKISSNLILSKTDFDGNNTYKHFLVENDLTALFKFTNFLLYEGTLIFLLSPEVFRFLFLGMKWFGETVLC